jgi:hypothetical protein
MRPWLQSCSLSRTSHHQGLVRRRNASQAIVDSSRPHHFTRLGALLLIKRNVGVLTAKEDGPTDWLGFEAQREALRDDCHAQSRRSGAPRLAVKLGGRKVAEPARPPQKAITADAQARSERPSSHPRDRSSAERSRCRYGSRRRWQARTVSNALARSA